MRRQRAAAALWAVLGALEYAEQLAHPAYQQPLFVDLHPCAGSRGEDHVVAGFDGHLHADVIPPIEAGADREHDALLRGRLIGPGRHQQAGAPHAIRVELLDHDAVE